MHGLMDLSEVDSRACLSIGDPRWDVPGTRVRVFGTMLSYDRDAIGKLATLVSRSGTQPKLVDIVVDGLGYDPYCFNIGELEFADPPGPLDYTIHDEGGVV